MSMFSLEMIKEELNRLSGMVNDEFDIPVFINSRLTTTLGRVIQEVFNGYCCSKKMEFSKAFLETSTEASIKSVIAHEWAHYYATKSTGERHGHDLYFKSICARVGCADDKATTEVERIVDSNPVYKYTVFCPNCNEAIGEYTRMCKTLRNLDDCTCGKCDGGNLYYIQNFQ